ncbi:MAG: hypothetical protein COT92_03750 [Candidatus Doudnabacteria bacterium CG10_big_fil_rev_8_21_14_0_10_42_18]|uniref:Uncharacterized protein n=1 Tax=Candidatus Doudnabacteria bacterium CG10_big_fil_rev_8_21_14_0_10_42_18 TaxID=1974552 RepID=A0A2H0VA51_9BACT|nr:MAG: hypothetical protein COT92_03750 [Candidatus Doudnabacteria bacterium CG10_big_fil_rev_8_21_14_0_10_42_18]
MTDYLNDISYNQLADEALKVGDTGRQSILVTKGLLDLKDSVNNLTGEIKIYSVSSSTSASAMTKLTYAIAFFAGIQAIGVIVSLFKS